MDSIKFSGDLIAGLSLLSTRTMVLSPEEEGEGNPASNPDLADIALRLPPRSLYVLRGKYRYDYRHEVLGPFSHSTLHKDDTNNNSNSSTTSGGSNSSSTSSSSSHSNYQNGGSSSSSDGFDRRMSIIFRNVK